MSVNHHGDEQSDLIKRFHDQFMGTAKREYPSGRLGAEDEGSLSYAMASDDRSRTIYIRFPKPIEWIGLGIKDAEQLRDSLTERICALKYGSVTGKLDQLKAPTPNHQGE